MAIMHVFSAPCVLLLLLAAVAQAQVSIPQTLIASVSDACAAINTQDACSKTSQCSWCGLADLAPSCVDKETLSSLPAGAVKCVSDNLGTTTFFGGRKGAAGASHTVKLMVDSTCSAEERESCLALQGCSWCNSKVSWIASECFTEIGTRNMDTSMFECETQQTAPSVLPPTKVSADNGDLVYGNKHKPGSYPPPPVIPCDDILDKPDCNARKTCNWCVLKFTGEGTCFTLAEAKYLPPFVFACSKKHRPQDTAMFT